MNLQEAANKYHKDKLSIIPIPYREKAASIRWEEYQRRHPNITEIRSWFNNSHKSNIAIICGKISNNLVVIDCDSDEKFYELAAIICDKTGTEDIFEFTTIVKTGKGFHIWLRTDESVKSQKFPQLDIKGEGGYVIAPPSMHPSGHIYSFVNDLITPPIKRISELKDIGINLEQKPETPISQPSWVSQLLKGVSEGQRNDAAARLAGYFKKSLPIDITTTILENWNTKNIPPLPLNELQSIIKSIYKYTDVVTSLIKGEGWGTGGGEGRIYTLPSGDDLDTERYNNVTESVTKALQGRGSVTEPLQKALQKRYKVGEALHPTLAKVIEEWVRDTTAWFSYDDIDKDLGIQTPNEKLNRRVIILRLKAAGVIETHQSNNKLLRYIKNDVVKLDFKAGRNRIPINLKMPFGIERYFNLYAKNIVVIAGAPDSGKTGWLLNLIRANQHNYEIYYQSSEMAKEELASRLENFEGIDLNDWTFTAEERSYNFADVIRPDAINIIDFLEITKDFFMVAEYLKEIHDKLTTGVAFVALQKNRGAELGRGGNPGLEKPRLYLTMDAGKIKIQKAKNWTDPTYNPNGLVLKFKIVAGCKLLVTDDWHYEEN